MKNSNGDLEYVEWNERETKTRHGGDLQGGGRAFEPKLFSPPDVPSERCPIVAFLAYKSKRPDTMLKAESPFYLAINHKPRNPNLWYKNSPMGENTLGTMMSRMAKRAGLVGKITNHSLRWTSLITLSTGGSISPPPITNRIKLGHTYS